jgi:hypothetical protein
MGIDSNENKINIHPRLPAGWTGFTARNWPVAENGDIKRVDISFKL